MFVGVAAAGNTLSVLVKGFGDVWSSPAPVTVLGLALLYPVCDSEHPALELSLANGLGVVLPGPGTMQSFLVEKCNRL